MRYPTVKSRVHWRLLRSATVLPFLSLSMAVCECRWLCLCTKRYVVHCYSGIIHNYLVIDGKKCCFDNITVCQRRHCRCNQLIIFTFSWCIHCIHCIIINFHFLFCIRKRYFPFSTSWHQPSNSLRYDYFDLAIFFPKGHNHFGFE